MESVEVETDSLQMHNKNVRSGCNHGALLQVNFPIAAVTLIIINDFTFDLLLKGLFNRLNSLDWEG